MRRLFRGRAGMALAFVLGLVIASAATAGASTLITGKQIKDGTIDAKDLTKGLRKQLKRVGPRGPQGLPGPPGPKGDPGPLTTTLPAGQTLRGAFNLDSVAAAANGSVGQGISFDFSMRANPTIVVRSVGAPASTECPGTTANPQAAAGVLCVYLSSIQNIQPSPPQFPDGLRVLGFGTPSANANAFGAELFIFSTAAGRFFADGTWAVTGN